MTNVWSALESDSSRGHERRSNAMAPSVRPVASTDTVSNWFADSSLATKAEITFGLLILRVTRNAHEIRYRCVVGAEGAQRSCAVSESE